MIYQEEQEIRESRPEEACFATIAQVYEDGVTLLFADQNTPSQKKYCCNSFAVFHAGDRVFLAKDSGTYVVLFPIGQPKAGFHADTATKATTATNAANAANASHADQAERLATARAIGLTGDVTASGSFNGAANLTMAATGVKAGAVKDQASPSSRTIQFRVASTGKLQFKSSYYNSGNWYNMDASQA
ncbi:MAG: hypothetical protein PHE47_08725 [Oscillospiraceae bacterium]|nr:hypothetical protein [Oscillospiraceae bacterium]